MESGTPVRVCGWGNTVIVGSSMPAELHCVNTQIVSNSVANGSDSYGGGILHGMFTAGMPSSNSISGKKNGRSKIGDIFLHQNFCIFLHQKFCIPFARKCFLHQFFSQQFFLHKNFCILFARKCFLHQFFSQQFFLHQNFCILFARKCFLHQFFSQHFFTPKILHSFCTKMFFYTNFFLNFYLIG